MKIQAIAPSPHIQGRYLIHLEDGSILKVTDNEVVSFHLFTGRELEEETLAALKEAAGESNAKSLAAKLIGRKPMSRKSLLQKLEEKGIDPEDAQTAADWLEDLGALDDQAYAETVVRYYSQRGYGRKKLETELYRRGVPKDCWEAALLEALPPENGVDKLLASKLRGKDPSDPKEIKRVSDALMRRGYSWSEIKEGLRRYGSDLENED
jgi:regulatory protein